ncbi:tyrosine-type recombinase/integrase [Noviherbaspirillum suwonense]|uniref:Site-specific recombinase XerD n=1 Tax=Noviherbaspirillum suwonense TaxID=1224511 RepID=A0ABY1Q6A2_9BURK|nr:tyrosine-type recombinase/integrase [Noviherbaspirillum suwonense]SMP61118.1 Site-specific recombinase XerD [Noviherbaspirillum suwonense]
MDMKSLGLYDNPDGWRREPLEAFTEFVRSEAYLDHGRRPPATDADSNKRPLRDSTRKNLIHMFGKFIKWIAGEQVGLFAVQPDHILRFLDAQLTGRGKGDIDMVSTIRARHVRLLERVYQHLEVSPNPASQAAHGMYRNREQGAAGVDKDTVALTREQEQAFLLALPGDPGDTSQNWKRRRDRAMLALAIGAGLKVSEIRGLYVENIGSPGGDGSIVINVNPAASDGTSLPHDTVLRQSYVSYLQPWLKERASLDLPGALLFPAGLRKNDKIDQATLYRQIKATFERADLMSVDHQGGRTLRNTFAVRELSLGTAVEQLYDLMGHRDVKTTESFVGLVRKYRPPL